jgi:hypothetical protein
MTHEHANIPDEPEGPVRLHSEFAGRIRHFRRYKSGWGFSLYVCLLPSLVKGAWGKCYGPVCLGASPPLPRDAGHHRYGKQHRMLPGKESLIDVVGYAMIVHGLLH